ncbi:MAG TPA: GGDEF and EAL domain-containing protein [Gammaproteobacteria bacterium]|nr:GGDEF and EAL domain-containing protein [Gammaproteobacteria bacterium]
MSGSPTIEMTARLFKSRANVYAIWGVLIAGAAVLVASALISLLQHGGLTIDGMVRAQSENPAIWLLDAMPFVFAVWGQYTGTMLSYRAGAMVLDETRTLRTRASALEYQLQSTRENGSGAELPGAPELEELVGRAIGQAEEQLALAAVMTVDFDQFHEIKRSLGPIKPDELLRSVCARLQGTIRDRDVLAHLGYDEFGILLQNVQQGVDIKRIAARIHRAIRAPLEIGGREVAVQPTMGVAVFPRDGSEATTLIRNAGIGKQMAHARREAICFFSPDMEHRAATRQQLVSDLRYAIEDDLLEPVFEPQVEAPGGEIVALRAGLTWKPSAHPPLREDDLFDLAESGGCLHDLVRRQFDRLLSRLHEWDQDQGTAGFRVSVPVAGRALTEFPFADLVTGLLASYDIDPERLVLEVGETALVDGGQVARAQLRSLGGTGARIALAGFGGPRSSVTALLGFRFAQVRLSPQLLAVLGDNADAAYIVESLIRMAARMQAMTVAPGVHDKRTYQALVDMGCDRIEGGYVHEAMDAAELGDWLALQSATGAGVTGTER